ncbi:MAG: hypothetical protein K5753_04855 [Clostridia bacterium]|nr:hypothetical protein [Clostridia bacterium]
MKQSIERNMGIIGFVITILSFVYIIISIFLPNKTAAIVVSSFCGVAIIARIIYQVLKKKKGGGDISDLMDIIDGIFEINRIIYEAGPRLSDCKKFYDKRACVKNDLSDILDNFCNSIQKYAKQKYSASIKIIENDNKIPSIMDKKIWTICRSKNSNKKRKNLDKQSTTAKENTCYKVILEDNQQNLFICGDLTNYSKETSSVYLNHNHDYLQYYKSIIVVPIATEEAYTEEEISSHNIIYGFLCVDSKEASDEKNITMVYEASLRQADLLVKYIQTYNGITGGYISEMCKTVL